MPIKSCSYFFYLFNILLSNAVLDGSLTETPLCNDTAPTIHFTTRSRHGMEPVCRVLNLNSCRNIKWPVTQSDRSNNVADLSRDHNNGDNNATIVAADQWDPSGSINIGYCPSCLSMLSFRFGYQYKELRYGCGFAKLSLKNVFLLNTISHVLIEKKLNFLSNLTLVKWLSKNHLKIADPL
jgi:hypothetical protein